MPLLNWEMSSEAESNAIPLNGFAGSGYGTADGSERKPTEADAVDGSGRKRTEADAVDGSGEDHSDLFKNEEVKVDLVDDVQREKEKLLQVRIC